MTMSSAVMATSVGTSSPYSFIQSATAILLPPKLRERASEWVVVRPQPRQARGVSLVPQLIQNERELHVHEEVLEALRSHLAHWNRRNHRFDEQFQVLTNVLGTALHRVQRQFATQVSRVYLTSSELSHGIDLRELPYGSVVLQIVLRSESRSYALYEEISAGVFANLDRSLFLPQFSLITPSEQDALEQMADEIGATDETDFLLLSRR